MDRTILAKIIAHLTLGGCTVVLGAWVKMPWPGLAGLILLNASLLVISLARKDATRKSALIVAWISTVWLPVALGLGTAVFTLDHYYAALSGMNSTAALMAMRNVADARLKSWGRVLILTWAFLGAGVVVTTSYVQNQAAGFHVGLGITLILLILVIRLFQPKTLCLQAVTTLILCLIGFPLADLLYRPVYRRGQNVELSKEYYSYAAAKKDPAAFAHWWNCYLKEWDNMAGGIFERDSTGRRPFRLRANGRGRLFESVITINSSGFRGPEIPEAKGDAYRIVALGESTTFGCTLRKDDRPWPEVLEGLIRERLKPDRPVQVINAGVPAHNLRHNLNRLQDEILALKPDLIISYHGLNGFSMIHGAMPPASGPPPPAFRPRPLRLLADCEHRLKMIFYRHRHTAKLILHPPDFTEPLRTAYADAYRELIHVVRTNGIRLVIGDYSMAVNSQSDLDVAEFYRTAAPAVHWAVRANAAHSTIVKQLAAQFPEVCFVDTHPGLDGHPEMFIDLGHFTQAGRQQLAENFYAGMREVLEADWGADLAERSSPMTLPTRPNSRENR